MELRLRPAHRISMKRKSFKSSINFWDYGTTDIFKIGTFTCRDIQYIMLKKHGRVHYAMCTVYTVQCTVYIKHICTHILYNIMKLNIKS